MKISYNGQKPNLCNGTLIVEIDDKVFLFPPGALVSGGSCETDDNYREIITKGPWTIDFWPIDFPEEYKLLLIKQINKELEWGCCGGCLG